MRRFLLSALLLLPAIGGIAVFGASAQRSDDFAGVDETRAAIGRAIQDRQAAEARASRLEAEAARAGQAADSTAQQAAALAARIQESEAGISIAQAKLALVRQQQRALMIQLAQKREPVVRLTAALQRFSRRPLALSVLRPGSVKQMVYLSAMLSTTGPEVRNRTAALRGEILRGQALRLQAEQAVTVLQAGERQLQQRHAELAALETRQRLELRQASGDADREAERALALGEQARDLNSLVAQLDQAGALRERLAQLPGPVMRPAQPAQSQVIADAGSSAPAPGSPPLAYQLPVTGRTLIGFGAPTDAGTISQGVTLAPPDGAVVVAPAAGRVAFAGPYRGYGQIVIVEHDGTWTSLVTGLVRVDVAVGQQLVGGSPLGIAAPRQARITLELRRGGKPVNPLEIIG